MIDLSILGTTMRMAAPILLAGTGALYNDRAGTTNITLEGTMLLGSFFAVTCSYFTQSWVMGALAGVATGVVISLLFYLLTVVLGGDDLVVGFAMNILLDGLSIFLLKQIFTNPVLWWILVFKVYRLFEQSFSSQYRFWAIC